MVVLMVLHFCTNWVLSPLFGLCNVLHDMFPPISFISFELLSCKKVWQVEIIWAKNYLVCLHALKTWLVFVGEVHCGRWIFLTSKIICWPEWVRSRGFTAVLGCSHLFERTFWISERVRRETIWFFKIFFQNLMPWLVFRLWLKCNYWFFKQFSRVETKILSM
jgi:hypothetical protein